MDRWRVPPTPVYLRHREYTREEIDLRRYVAQNTPEWLQLRSGKKAVKNNQDAIVDATLQASAMNEFYGINAYKSADDAVKYMQGCFPLANNYGYEAYLGHHFEDDIALCGANALGLTTQEVGIVVNNKAPFLGASIDRLTNVSTSIIECKHMRYDLPTKPKPEHLIQVMQQLYLEEATQAFLIYGHVSLTSALQNTYHLNIRIFDVSMSSTFIERIHLPIAREVDKALMITDPSFEYIPPIPQPSKRIQELIHWKQVPLTLDTPGNRLPYILPSSTTETLLLEHEFYLCTLGTASDWTGHEIPVKKELKWELLDRRLDRLRCTSPNV